MQFCLRHAERCTALVLLVPLAWTAQPAAPRQLTRLQGFILDHVLQSDLLFWAATRLSLFRDAMVETILGTPLADFKSASAADQRRTYAMLDLIQPISSRSPGLRERVVTQALRRYDLESIAAPTLVASVEDCGYGTYEPARYTAEHIPGARFIGHARGGHL